MESPVSCAVTPVSWRCGSGAIIRWHTRTTTPPRVGNGDTLVLGGGFSAHREVSVDLMAGRNFFIMN